MFAIPYVSDNAPAGSPQGNSISSLQGVSSSLQALRPQGPTITPSLANHYRDDLVNHVRGWPADILEKQVIKQNVTHVIIYPYCYCYRH